MKNSVISCGGGIVLNKINIDYLKRSSIIICLITSVEKIYERTMKDGKEKRPLLANPDPLNSIRTLLNFREPFYKAAGDVFINTTNLTLDECCDKIIETHKKF